MLLLVVVWRTTGEVTWALCSTVQRHCLPWYWQLVQPAAQVALASLSEAESAALQCSTHTHPGSLVFIVNIPNESRIFSDAWTVQRTVLAEGAGRRKDIHGGPICHSVSDASVTVHYSNGQQSIMVEALFGVLLPVTGLHWHAYPPSPRPANGQVCNAPYLEQSRLSGVVRSCCTMVSSLLGAKFSSPEPLCRALGKDSSEQCTSEQCALKCRRRYYQ